MSSSSSSPSNTTIPRVIGISPSQGLSISPLRRSSTGFQAEQNVTDLDAYSFSFGSVSTIYSSALNRLASAASSSEPTDMTLPHLVSNLNITSVAEDQSQPITEVVEPIEEADEAQETEEQSDDTLLTVTEEEWEVSRDNVRGLTEQERLALTDPETEQQRAYIERMANLPPVSTFRADRPMEFEDYPKPEEVLADNPLIASLNTSGIIDLLRVIPFKVLENLGPCRIGSDLGDWEVGPYVQITLKFIQKYYRTLPSIGISFTTLQLLHYYLRLISGLGNTQPHQSIAELYLTISGEGVDEVIYLTARCIIDDSTKAYEDLRAVSNTSLMSARLNSIKTQAPEIYAVYNMLGHFCHGGIDCIRPILSIMRTDPGLSAYVAAVTRGTERLVDSDFEIIPRNPSLPVADHQILARSQSGTSLQQPSVEPTPIRPSYPTFLSPVSSMPIRVSSMTSPARPHSISGSSIRPPHNPQVPIRIFEQGQSSGVRTPPLSHPDSRSLLSQGAPSRPPVVRDTTSFRTGVQADIQDRQDTDSIIESIEKVNSKCDQLQNTLLLLVERVERMDRTLATLTVHSSIQNLGDREVFNRAILSQTNQVAADIMSQASTPSPARATNLAEIRRRVLTFPGSAESAVDLAANLKAFLEQMGETSFAALITPSALKNSSTKVRILTRLDSLSRGP